MSEDTEDQLGLIQQPPPLCSMQTEDDDSSETSDDDDEQIKSLYSKLPEDLGFTLVGLEFGHSDFKTLKKLKMDLDTFLTLSAQELTDLGLKESSKMQASISNMSQAQSQVVHRKLFWKPRVRDLRISSDDVLSSLTNTFKQIQEMRQYLEYLQFTFSISPPVNYMLTNEHCCRDVFRNAMARALIHTKCVSLEVNNLVNKFEEEAKLKHKKLMEKRKLELYGKPATVNKIAAEEENVVIETECVKTEYEQTEVNDIGKRQSSNSFYNFRNCVVALTTSGALLLALLTLRKYV